LKYKFGQNEVFQEKGKFVGQILEPIFSSSFAALKSWKLAAAIDTLI
jgi:hypothetical protein